MTQSGDVLVDGRSGGLCFDRVEIALDQRPVLRGVTLDVPPGSVTALVGANGAGKTTLLRLATRWLHASAGRIEIEGRDVESFSRAELARHVAVVPQESVIPFPFRVDEIVAMGRAPHLRRLGFETRHDVVLVRSALERTGIAALSARSVLTLSGGQRQLVALARALVQDAPILLMDEPTAFLDLRHRVEVLSLARAEAARGRAVLLVSHDLALAARFCDRLALLAGGCITAVGAPADVLTPGHLRDVFGIEAQILVAPDGTPVVVPLVRAGGEARGIAAAEEGS